MFPQALAVDTAREGATAELFGFKARAARISGDARAMIELEPGSDAANALVREFLGAGTHLNGSASAFCEPHDGACRTALFREAASLEAGIRLFERRVGALFADGTLNEQERERALESLRQVGEFPDFHASPNGERLSRIGAWEQDAIRALDVCLDVLQPAFSRALDSAVAAARAEQVERLTRTNPAAAAVAEIASAVSDGEKRKMLTLSRAAVRAHGERDLDVATEELSALGGISVPASLVKETLHLSRMEYHRDVAAVAAALGTGNDAAVTILSDHGVRGVLARQREFANHGIREETFAKLYTSNRELLTMQADALSEYLGALSEYCGRCPGGFPRRVFDPNEVPSNFSTLARVEHMDRELSRCQARRVHEDQTWFEERLSRTIEYVGDLSRNEANCGPNARLVAECLVRLLMTSGLGPRSYSVQEFRDAGCREGIFESKEDLEEALTALERLRIAEVYHDNSGGRKIALANDVLSSRSENIRDAVSTIETQAELLRRGYWVDVASGGLLSSLLSFGTVPDRMALYATSTQLADALDEAATYNLTNVAAVHGYEYARDPREGSTRGTSVIKPPMRVTHGWLAARNPFRHGGPFASTTDSQAHVFRAWLVVLGDHGHVLNMPHVIRTASEAYIDVSRRVDPQLLGTDISLADLDTVYGPARFQKLLRTLSGIAAANAGQFNAALAPVNELWAKLRACSAGDIKDMEINWARVGWEKIHGLGASFQTQLEPHVDEMKVAAAWLKAMQGSLGIDFSPGYMPYENR